MNLNEEPMSELGSLDHGMMHSPSTEAEMVLEALKSWPCSRAEFLVLKTGLRPDEIVAALDELEWGESADRGRSDV